MKEQNINPKAFEAANKLLLSSNSYDKIMKGELTLGVQDVRHDRCYIKTNDGFSIENDGDDLKAFLKEADKIVNKTILSNDFYLTQHSYQKYTSVYFPRHAGSAYNQEYFKKEYAENMLKVAGEIKQAYQHLEKLHTEIENEMKTLVTGINNTLKNQERAVNKSEEIEKHINLFSKKFSDLPKDEIAKKTKALVKEIIEAEETKKDWLYPVKEACK